MPTCIPVARQQDAPPSLSVTKQYNLAHTPRLQYWPLVQVTPYLNLSSLCVWACGSIPADYVWLSVCLSLLLTFVCCLDEAYCLLPDLTFDMFPDYACCLPWPLLPSPITPIICLLPWPLLHSQVTPTVTLLSGAYYIIWICLLSATCPDHYYILKFCLLSATFPDLCFKSLVFANLPTACHLL